MRRTAYWAIAAMLAVSAFAVPGNVTTASAADAAPAATDSSEKSFTLVSVMIDDVKFWLPSTIVVDQGDKVKLTLKNQVPGAENQHGFTIPGYNITQIVTRGVPTTVSFVADKAGVFPYSCQLHPAHIGGQLIVHAKQ
ncbi:MAG TPA: cupredoxin domain-containing protein [Candidatus Binataceae bacterium]